LKAAWARPPDLRRTPSARWPRSVPAGRTARLPGRSRRCRRLCDLRDHEGDELPQSWSL